MKILLVLLTVVVLCAKMFTTDPDGIKCDYLEYLLSVEDEQYLDCADLANGCKTIGFKYNGEWAHNDDVGKTYAVEYGYIAMFNKNPVYRRVVNPATHQNLFIIKEWETGLKGYDGWKGVFQNGLNKLQGRRSLTPLKTDDCKRETPLDCKDWKIAGPSGMNTEEWEREVKISCEDENYLNGTWVVCGIPDIIITCHKQSKNNFKCTTCHGTGLKSTETVEWNGKNFIWQKGGFKGTIRTNTNHAKSIVWSSDVSSMDTRWDQGGCINTANGATETDGDSCEIYEEEWDSRRMTKRFLPKICAV